MSSAVSSIPGWTPLAPRLATTGNPASQAGTPAPVSASPSSIVRLSPESVAASAQGSSASLFSTLSWENKSQDKVSMLMAGNISTLPLSQRFSGLGAALLSQFKGDVSNVSQAVRSSSKDAQPDLYGVAAANAASSLHGNGDNKVSFSITTKSGGGGQAGAR